MEKTHEVEAFEKEQSQGSTQVDVSKYTTEELQEGIDANLNAMVEQFVGRLTVLENLIGRKVNVKVNARLIDGRRVHFRVTEK